MLKDFVCKEYLLPIRKYKSPLGGMGQEGGKLEWKWLREFTFPSISEPSK